MPAGATKFGSEFLVNSITTNFQGNADVVGLTDGRFVAVWIDRSNGDTFDVRAQMFNADGTKAGAEFLINSTTTDNQSSPAVAALPDGGFVVAFVDNSAVNDDIRVRIFNADGTPRGNDFIATTLFPLESQTAPDVTVLTNGNFIVTWNLLSPGNDVHAQIFDSNGQLIGGEISITASPGSADQTPAIAALAGGGFAIAWEGFFNDPTDIGVQLFDAAGHSVGPAFQVNTFLNGAGVGRFPAITALKGGGFVVSWQDEAGLPPNLSGFAVRARVFDANGVPISNDFNATMISRDDQSEPAVTALADGRFVLTWTDDSQAGGETGKAIHAQVFDTNGTKVGTEFFVNTTTFLDQFRSSVAGMADGRFVVSWDDSSLSADDASSGAVRGQIFDPRIAAVNLTGTSLGDDWVGTAFADTMTGAAGNDRMDGGGGTDTAVFSGLRSAYTIGSTGSDVQIVGPDGTDLLKNFEFAKFDDLTIALSGSDSPSGPQGTPGDDSIAAPSGSSQINGGAGIDAITFNLKLTDVSVSYVGNKVIIDGPSSHTVLTGFEKYVFADGIVDNNDRDPLVDDLFYYSRNHDVWNAHADADAHFHTFGWREFRDPNAFFDTDFYLALNVNVRRSGADPLVQFDQSGWNEGRVPSPVFDPAAYLAANPDVKAAGVDPLAHFLRYGAAEGRQPFAVTELIAPNGFDYIYYLQHNPVQHISETSMEWAFPGCSPARTTGWDYTGTTR